MKKLISFTNFRSLLLFALISSTSFSNAFGQRPGGPSGERKAKVKIFGIVQDASSGQVMEYATVSVFAAKDSSLITGALTDIDGKFELEVNPRPAYIVMEYISYDALTVSDLDFSSQGPIDLGVLTLTQSGTELETVEIQAERSETTFSLDKKIFTVGKDLANRGGSAEDILDNVPSVTVDIDGNVSLRGSDGVRILIDGKPSGLAGVGNTNGLRNIPSNLIEKVEVVTNPSARYEAEGMAGIINIVLKKQNGGGFNGAFDVNFGYPLQAGAAANVNYRRGPLNWFASYGLNYRENPGGGYTLQDQSITDDLGAQSRRISYLDRAQNRTGLSNSIRFGLDYFLSDKEQLTGALIYRKSDENNFAELAYNDYTGISGAFSEAPFWNRSIDDLKAIDFRSFGESLPEQNLISRTFRTDDEKEDEKNLEYNLNYRKEFSSREHTLNASVQYREKSETESSLFDQNEMDGSGSTIDQFNQRSNNAESEKTLLFQLDFVRPLGKDHKYELGIRSQLRDITNDFLVEEQTNGDWFSLRGLSNNFIYNEDIHAAYAIYGNTIGKFSYQAGLRLEYSDISTELEQTDFGEPNDRSYLNLFPSGSLNYALSDVHALQVSYSKRVRRPRFWDLNPFFTFSDNRNFFSGNPNIDPEYSDSYEIGQISYWENFSINTSIFYRYYDASIQRVLIANKFENTTLRVPLNLGQVQDLGLDISASFSGVKWLRLDGNWNIFRNQLSLNATDISDVVYNYYLEVREFGGDETAFNQEYAYTFNETDNITWNGRLTARITVFESDTQLRFNYRGARETSQGRSAGIGSVDLGWSKDFLKKKLSLTLSVRDLFNSRRRDSFTLFDEFFQQGQFQWRSRSANIALSYRINQKKKRTRSGGGYNGGGGEF